MSEALSDSLNEILGKYFAIDSISNDGKLLSHFTELYREELHTPYVWEEIEQQVNAFIDFRRQSYTYIPSPNHFLGDLRIAYELRPLIASTQH